MTTLSSTSINHFNSFLILFSLTIAYVVPHELLLFSYAFLGPAHYLTQISWLHNRKYFSKSRLDILPLVLFTLLLIFEEEHNKLWLIASLCYVGVAAYTSSWFLRIPLTIVFSYLAVFLLLVLDISGFLILIPTLIHVFLFTLLFMIFGALKEKSKSAMISAVILFLGGLTFLMFTPATTPQFTNYVQENFSFLNFIPEALADLLGVAREEPLFMHIVGFAAFAYTYHFLNWFSKTRLIGWHEISKERAIAIVLLYAASISIYLYDYGLGFKLLLLLSLLHVLLEFPLDWMVIKGLGKSLLGAFKPSKA